MCGLDAGAACGPCRHAACGMPPAGACACRDNISFRHMPTGAETDRLRPLDTLRSVPTPPRRTALYDRHVAAGAKLVEFAGCQMPVQYAGVRAEHMAVREGVGMFDVSHMGEIETSGPQSLQLLQRLISNDLSKVPVGGAQYGVICREDGGVLDDLFTYRLEADRWLTVSNAANHASDLEWFCAHARELDAEVEDRIEDYAMLAVQGPRARELVQAISDAPLPAADERGHAAAGGLRDAGVRHRLHRRGRRRAAALTGRRPRAVG